MKDSYYGDKVSGLIPIGEFVVHLLGEPIEPVRSGVAHYTVKSLADAQSILSSDRHSAFRQKMSFRGQTKEFYLRRTIPNPRIHSDAKGEPMILPQWWRSFSGEDPIKRESRGRSIFTTPLLSERLVFHGIPDWADHAAKHQLEFADYLEEFPDE